MLKQLSVKILLFVSFIYFGTLFATNDTSFDEVVPLVPMKLAKHDLKQIECMAKNIIFEAGSESIKGQAAVARVVMNRVREGFATTPCAVIYQVTQTENGKVCQFSWVCENKPEPNKSSYSYKVARQVAYDVIVNDKYDDVISDDILYFHRYTVTPVAIYQSAIRIGNHLFYAIKNKHGR
jgi:spore germination cell wall hydrolase CwlJ-like protein